LAQLIVRNIEDSTKAALKRLARRNGHSMEEEVREILRSAAHQRTAPQTGLGTEIANLFADIGFEGEIPELKGFSIRPPEFDT
jgi:plasmid stability protein